MKKCYFFAALAFAYILLFSLVTSSVQAAGGKVRGNNSTGPAYQQGNCPFKG